MQAIANQLSIGEPQVTGALAVFPIFGPEPRLAYRAFAHASELGAFVKELDEGASVGDLRVGNPTDQPLLVYEGEEVLGAQQNRTFDGSTLVPAGGRVELPVSCVEEGRWDGRRFDERMVPSPQAADPSMRRAKRESANLSVARGQQARADQGLVWNAVGERLDAHGVDSDSAALNDVFDDLSDELDDLVAGVRHEHGQIGAVAQVGGRPVVFDMVSRPDVFQSLLPRLARGYALEARRVAAGGPDPDAASTFLSAALHAPKGPQPTPGLGECFGVVAPELAGSGLECYGELIQLSVFPAEGDGGQGDARPGRIAQPSRRRLI